MRLQSEAVGAFIDAVYAIAVTILALEIPSELESVDPVENFALVLLEYGIAFVVLFSFWYQHRRVNGLTKEVSRAALWINAAVLLLVCLVPVGTKLVFEHGGNVTLALLLNLSRGQPWNLAEIVDLFYVGVVIFADLGILALLVANLRSSASENLVWLRRSKTTTTALLLLIMCLSFLLPVENRYFLLVIPLALFLEQEIVQLLNWRR